MVERLAGGPLFGLLLRLPDALAHRLAAEEHRRGELLLVIGPPFLEAVLRHGVELAGGELLQDRLVVAVALAPGVGLHERTEEPLDQPAGLVETEIEVHGPDDGLEGIGQDARLVPATALLFPLTEPDERSEAQ